MKKKYFVVAVAVVSLLAIGVAFWMKRPMSSADQARLCAHALWHGDTDLVYAYAADEDINHGLTASAFHKIWKRTIEPKTRLYRVVGDSVGAAGGRSVCYLSLERISDGTRSSNPFSFVLRLTGTGPKSNLYNLLVWAWTDEVVEANDLAMFDEALIRGAEADLAFLKGLGVKGLVISDPQDPGKAVFKTWDELIVRHKAHAARRRAKPVQHDYHLR